MELPALTQISGPAILLHSDGTGSILNAPVLTQSSGEGGQGRASRLPMLAHCLCPFWRAARWRRLRCRRLAEPARPERHRRVQHYGLGGFAFDAACRTTVTQARRPSADDGGDGDRQRCCRCRP